VRHGDDGTGKFLQELLEPVDALGVEVIGRFVQQQHVGLRQQEPAQRDTALLAARECGDLRVPGRQAQRGRGDFHLHAGIRARCGDDRLEPRLLGGERVEVGAFLGVRRVDLVQTLLRTEDIAHPFLDRLAHRLAWIELWLLWQKTDLQTRHRDGFAFDLLVYTRHDAQQARFAGSVQTQHADLGAGKEGKRDVFQDLPLGRDHLAHAVHRVHVLRHGDSGLRKCKKGRNYRIWLLHRTARR